MIVLTLGTSLHSRRDFVSHVSLIHYISYLAPSLQPYQKAVSREAMPIPTTQESGSDTDHAKVSSPEMKDEKPSVPIKMEVDNEPKQAEVKGEKNGMEEHDELEEKIEAAVKKFRQRTARSVTLLRLPRLSNIAKLVRKRDGADWCSAKEAAWPFAQKTLDFSNRYPVLFVRPQSALTRESD